MIKKKIEEKVAEKISKKIFSDLSKKKAKAKKEQPEKKDSIIREIINNPDKFELLARVEDGEFVIRIKEIQ